VLRAGKKTRTKKTISGAESGGLTQIGRGGGVMLHERKEKLFQLSFYRERNLSKKKKLKYSEYLIGSEEVVGQEEKGPAKRSAKGRGAKIVRYQCQENWGARVVLRVAKQRGELKQKKER